MGAAASLGRTSDGSPLEAAGAVTKGGVGNGHGRGEV